MASVTKEGKTYRIRFMGVDGRRKSIRLGKAKSVAAEVSRHIEAIVSAKLANTPMPRNTAAWLSDVSDGLWSKLAATGLVEPRGSSGFCDFVGSYIADGKTSTRADAAPGTIKKWKATYRHLKAFFGQADLRAIQAADVDEFRRWLETQTVSGRPMAENTIRSVMAQSKMFCNAAIRRGLIEASPFVGQVAATLENKERSVYVKPELACTLIDRGNPQWALMIALWRFAGLRKMEIFELRWSDILWDRGRMRVRSPKTAHHDGREERYVPIGDIEQQLLESAESAESDWLITQYSKSNSNLDKPFKQLIKDAGYLVWPKVFQNLRASCETDWLDRGLPAHVVAAWIGHSVTIQAKHYAQVDDHHFDVFNTHENRAVKPGPKSGPRPNHS